MAKVYEFEPGEPRCYLDTYRETVDLRVFMAESDWQDYRKELDEVVQARHVPLPTGRWPLVCATAFLNGQWVHEWLELRQFRDYFTSLLEHKQAGPSMKTLENRRRARDRRAMQETEIDEGPPSTEPEDDVLPRIEFEDPEEI